MIPDNGVNGVNGHRVRPPVMEVLGTDTELVIRPRLSMELNFVK